MPKLAKAATSSPQKRVSSKKKPIMSLEQREQMIAVAAYYLAEQRGFIGGDPMSDWLQAESLIDQSFH